MAVVFSMTFWRQDVVGGWGKSIYYFAVEEQTITETQKYYLGLGSQKAKSIASSWKKNP